MGQKAKNAGKKKTEQFEAKLATTKSLAPRASRIKWNKAVVLDVATLSEQQQAELATCRDLLCTQTCKIQNNWLGVRTHL